MKWYYGVVLAEAALAVLALGGLFAWYFWRGRKAPAKAAKARTGAGRPAGKKAADLRAFWQVKDLTRDGVLVLEPGNRYRLVCRVAAPDFWLLGEAEQDQVEEALRQALLGLPFPVQALIVSEAVDADAAVRALRESAVSLPPALAEYALARADYLEALVRERSVSARNAYLVIPYEDEASKGVDHARGELFARAANLASALAGAKMRLEPLDASGAADLLAHVLNRGRAWRPSEAAEKGFFAEFHIAEKEAVLDEVA